MKIQYWWDKDNEWFCILTDDGVGNTTVSLTPAQAAELRSALKIRPQQPVDSVAQRPGESDADWERRTTAFINGEDVRTKTDLRDFKTADFHLNKEAI